jgi:hypothetical protein
MLVPSPYILILPLLLFPTSSTESVELRPLRDFQGDRENREASRFLLWRKPSLHARIAYAVHAFVSESDCYINIWLITLSGIPHRHLHAIRPSGNSQSEIRHGSAKTRRSFGCASREYADSSDKGQPSAYPDLYESHLWARQMTHTDLTPADGGELYGDSNRLILHLNNIGE